MITNNLSIIIAQDPTEAPNYNDNNEFTAIKIDKAIIVKKGTRNGNPTVDLQLSDKTGQKYVVFATGNILEMLAQAFRSVKHN